MRTLLIAAALAALLASEAHAQRRRSSGRGVPCGRSYIAPGKVCHIDTPPPAPAADSTRTRGDSAVSPPRAPNAVAPAAGSAEPSSTASGPAYATALRAASGWHVTVQGAPGDLHGGLVAWVYGDHLVVKSGAREYRIPFTAIAYSYTDATKPLELVLVMRR